MADGPVAHQGKRALLVGINEYPNFPPERQLRGCLNDVALLRATLRDRFGFDDASMTVLTNEQATRDGILAAMKKLVDDTRDRRRRALLLQRPRLADERSGG